MIKQNKPTHFYIGRKHGCGCIMQVTNDHSQNSKSDARFTASSVADAIRRGLYIERITFEQYTELSGQENFLNGCPHTQKRLL